MRLARFAVLSLLLGCRTPTQITLEISTDTGCPNQKTAIVIGHAGDIDTRPPSTTTSQCDPGSGRIGDLVVVPSGADDGDIAFEVIAGLNKDPDGCRPPDPANLAQCIIARRALRFIPHEDQTVPILLSQACVDHYCPPGQTCAFGMCQDEALPPLPGADAASDVLTDVRGDATSEMPPPQDAAAETSVVTDATPPDAGSPILMGTLATGSLAFIVVNQGVAYVSDANSTVSRCDTTCATFAGSQSAPNRMAIDSSNVYWAEYTSPGGVFGCAFGTSCAGEIQYDGSHPVSALATDGAELFWSAGTSAETIYSCRRLSCTATQMTIWYGSAGSIATDRSNVFWTDFGNGAVDSVPYGSVAASAIVLASGESSPFGIAVDTSNVYWTTFVGMGELRAVTKSGGALTSLASAQNYPHDLVYDGTSALYWTNAGSSGAGDGSIMKCQVPSCAGAPQRLASGRAHPWGIAVDSTWVYWTERDSGQVWKLPK